MREYLSITQLADVMGRDFADTTWMLVDLGDLDESRAHELIAIHAQHNPERPFGFARALAD